VGLQEPGAGVEKRSAPVGFADEIRPSLKGEDLLPHLPVLDTAEFLKEFVNSAR
jgi:hypothetical protein